MRVYFILCLTRILVPVDFTRHHNIHPPCLIVLPQPLQRQQGNRRKLYTMRDYCANLLDCRRVLTLAYFNEAFDRALCGNRCDNCIARTLAFAHDLTAEAQRLVRLVSALVSKSRIVVDGVSTVRKTLVKTVWAGKKGKQVECVDVTIITMSLLCLCMLLSLMFPHTLFFFSYFNPFFVSPPSCPQPGPGPRARVRIRKRHHRTNDHFPL